VPGVAQGECGWSVDGVCSKIYWVGLSYTGWGGDNSFTAHAVNSIDTDIAKR